jgi:sec-independent protein translocase protein TatB
MTLGITPEKIILLVILIGILIGPSRLPEYAARIGEWVRRGRVLLKSAQDRLKEEMGPEFDDVDWQKLDPRKYDPRTIIRDALREDIIVAPVIADATPPTPSPAPAIRASIISPASPQNNQTGSV